jgi:hypothetical protein
MAVNGFPPPGAETRQGLENIITLIDRTFPLPGKFRRGLPQDVAELSRLLTGGRGDRTESYLGKPALLSAYLRYFLPWNLYRLCRLLPALPLPLEDGDALSDLGSGPLTLTLGLWLARPELRGLSLEFRCLDRTGAALDAGLELFHALAGPASPWKIRPIRAALGAPIHGRPARLVSAVNLFNELYGKLPETDRTGFYALAEKQARLLAALAPGGSVLVVEPGNPRGGAFIAALRSRLLSAGLPPLAPCPHHGPCPLEREPGRSPKGGTRWCHFALDTAAAPAELQRLSAAAGLPKERASLSFLLAGQAGEGAGGQGPADHEPPEPAVLSIRHISDPFPVGGGGEYGRYGCSERGLVLVTGERRAVEACLSGALFQLPPARPERRDPKSGALVVELPSNSARRA